MIEEALEAIESTIEDARKKFFGVMPGTVTDLTDPLMLGRVRVQLPSVDAADLQPWARVAVPFAGMLYGHYFIPSIGEEVLVAFEHGDISAPYIIGSLWNGMAPPPLQSPLAEIRAIRTQAGNQIVFTDTPASVTVQTGPTTPSALPMPPSPTGPHHTIMLSSAGIQAMSPTTIVLQVGQSSVIVTSNGITLQSSGNVVALTPGGVSITASGPLNITASGPCSVTAPLIKLN